MKSRILFLNPYKITYFGKTKNLDIISSISDAYTLYDYSSFIFDHDKWHMLTSEINLRIFNIILSGGVLLLLIQNDLDYIDVGVDNLVCEKIGKTLYSKTITRRKNVEKYLELCPSVNSTISTNLDFIKLLGQKRKLEPFMIHENTNKVFYGAIEFGSGKIVILPRLKNYESETVDLLIAILNEFLGVEPVIITRRPEWVEKYMTTKEKIVDSNLNKLEEDYKIFKTNLLDEKRKFLELNKLIYAQSDELVDAVKFAFEIIGCKVEKTERGANIDLYITYKDKKFFAEVTGTVSKIDKSSNKLIQIMQGAQKDSDLKPLLLANTHMDKEISKRSEENFTTNAINFMQGCKPCCMTTVNLFYLIDSLLNEKTTTDKIIKSIYETIGIFSI